MVRTRDIVAGFRNLAGVEIKEYTELVAESRDLAIKRMVEKARAMGASAVLGRRFSTSAIMSGAAEVMAYGTAVVLERE